MNDFVDRGHRPASASRPPQLGKRSLLVGPPAGFHLTRLSGARLVLLSVAISILIGLVVFASRASTVAGGQASHSPAVAAIGQTIILLVIAGDLAFMALIAYAVLSGRRRGKGTEENEHPYQPPVHWAWKVVTAAFPLVLLLGLVLAVHTLSSHGVHPSPATGIPTGRSLPGSRPTAGRTSTPGFTTPALLAAAAITLVAVIIGFLLTRARLNRVFEPLLARDLSESIDDSLDDIRREKDPRRAVIVAYARMERVLRVHGLPRREYEAPREYLARVLGGLRVRNDAIGSLTDLFELARFSQHDIGLPMKEQAISALVAVRNDLEEVA